MKARFWARITAATIATAALGAGLLFGAPPLTEAAHADVNDFEIESFDATYTLSRDSTGRSALHTVEHIVAVFPDHDQNRGLIRDITRVYDGHNTNVAVRSVTDETGEPRDYTTEPYGDFLAVTIAVPEGQFVHGPQHYVIEYTQQDVTRFFDDTGVDEFYWDVNGTGWTQPFGRVSARVEVSDELSSFLTGDSACYFGEFGSGDRCTLTAEGSMFTTEVHDLRNGENVTIAIAFEPGTFAAAPKPVAPFLQRVPLLIWAGLASFIAAIATFIATLIRGRGAKTGRAIVAWYEPPPEISVSIAAEMLRARSKAMTATLLDFAVRRKLRLLHDESTDLYGAQALDQSGLLPIEDRTYAKIFAGSIGEGGVAPGTTHWFSRSNTRLGDAAADLKSRAKLEVARRGLLKKRTGSAAAGIIVLLLLALGLPLMHTIIFDNTFMMAILLAVGCNVLIWGSVAVLVILSRIQTPTHEGALLLDHLQGLREYIRLAEADRIRMLQSASGAEIGADRIVQIYERLLPYAVLFGHENEWQAELARYYRESVPDWVYASDTDSMMRALSITGLTRAVNSAPVTRAVSSYGSGSGSSFSSFSGGSSGGGFSGGGGGGGGGRGI